MDFVPIFQQYPLEAKKIPDATLCPTVMLLQSAFLWDSTSGVSLCSSWHLHFGEYRSVMLQTLSQFRIVCCFLISSFRLCHLGRNVTQMMLTSSQCSTSGGTCLVPLLATLTLIMRLRRVCLVCPQENFYLPFEIPKYLVWRYSEPL